ncbi:MAG: hypothetical protein PHS32_12835 [Rhodoferax sp.]|uniref:hypothetical protein n=1 Tax=Rhodoferax sp. TaxID=50421 RepID=UPI00261DD10B|nr:hypothetical protein [Rhodoferax sp.]MDD5334618.1 hypothetical protein [Rhodoferax sp.]
MVTDFPDAATQARLHDLAKCEAVRLRGEAVGDFWRGADAVLGTTADHARRSAQRLAYRLARRARDRSTRAASVSETALCSHCN